MFSEQDFHCLIEAIELQMPPYVPILYEKLLFCWCANLNSLLCLLDFYERFLEAHSFSELVECTKNENICDKLLVKQVHTEEDTILLMALEIKRCDGNQNEYRPWHEAAYECANACREGWTRESSEKRRCYNGYGLFRRGGHEEKEILAANCGQLAEDFGFLVCHGEAEALQLFQWYATAHGGNWRIENQQRLHILLGDAAGGPNVVGPFEPAQPCDFTELYWAFSSNRLFDLLEASNRYTIGVRQRNSLWFRNLEKYLNSPPASRPSVWKLPINRWTSQHHHPAEYGFMNAPWSLDKELSEIYGQVFEFGNPFALHVARMEGKALDYIKSIVPLQQISPGAQFIIQNLPRIP